MLEENPAAGSEGKSSKPEIPAPCHKVCRVPLNKKTGPHTSRKCRLFCNKVAISGPRACARRGKERTWALLMNIYETRRLLDEYLLFHYGSAAEILPHEAGPGGALDFAVRTVIENASSAPRRRALDVGCAVGRSSFELSRFCDEVVGIDFSRAFVEAAEQLRQGAKLEYRRHEEAALFTTLTAAAPPGARLERVSFEVGDAMALRADLGEFDLVHAANLICRLPEPLRFLERLPSLVRAGGTLILTTPCTWLGEFTPPENWPAGSTLDWLRGRLAPHFTLTTARDMPFLIREHVRKYQWSVAQASVWERTATAKEEAAL